MDKEEYFEKLNAIEREYCDKKRLLAKEYAISNSNIKAVDIIEDHIGKIRIEKISFVQRAGFNYEDLPYCAYLGSELRKDEVPKKNVYKRYIHQINLKTK